MMKSLLLFLFLCSHVPSLHASKILQFQSESGGTYSTEEWAEFKGKIPHMMSFTACHWEKLRFFSVRESCHWAFCYKNTNASADHHCTQFWYIRDPDSGGRYVHAYGGFGDNSFGGNGHHVHNLVNVVFHIGILLKKFKHRSWNHICWAFQSKTGLSKIYLNGELGGSFVIESDFIREGILGSDEVLESAFIIGQDPDPPSPRGGFESEQVFVGDITELNIWNFTLDEVTIDQIGNCKSFEKGNIIAWNLENLDINNVKSEEHENMKDLCKSVEQLLVFPKKRSWNAAWTLCLAHGGSVHTPENKDENIQLSNAMEPYLDACADPVSGNLAWLGIKSKNFIWSKIEDRKTVSGQDFTNWKVSAPYFESYECGFIKTDGTWDSDLNCNKKVKLCTVCKISGEPLPTIFVTFYLPIHILKGTLR